MSAATDSLANVAYDPINQPGITNLIDIYSSLSGLSLDESISKFAGQTEYGEFKSQVAEKVEEFLVKFQQSLAVVDDEQLKNKLHDSEAKMNQVANQTLQGVQKAVGLRN